jgi:CDP-diacylglycerol--serine O-phosphatidyltransferase
MFPGRDPRRPTPTRKFRRGLVLLPSLITVGNLFCGYACIVHAMRGQLETAAPFIGVAVILDMLDGRIARLTGTTSAFGLEFDSLADMVSFGLAPAVLAFAWGLSGLGKAGWAAGFVYVAATAMRLARFNIQSPGQSDKRYFVGIPSPAAAGVPAATVFLLADPTFAYAALVAGPGVRAWISAAVMIIPGLLMVSTIRFRSFKTIDPGWQRSYVGVLVFILFIAFIMTEPATTLVMLSYGYLCSAFIGMALTRVKGRRTAPRTGVES